MHLSDEIPLSDREKRLLLREHDLAPGDRYRDVVINLSLSINYERCYRVWTELNKLLSPDQQSQLVQWAQDQSEAAFPGTPSQLVNPVPLLDCEVGEDQSR